MSDVELKPLMSEDEAIRIIMSSPSWGKQRFGVPSNSLIMSELFKDCIRYRNELNR